MLKITLPEQVTACITKLNNHGFEAYLVGGCVRDYLLDLSPKDIDIATNAQPTEVIRVFAGFRVIETGLKHGTVTVVIDAMPIEITSYRGDAAANTDHTPHTEDADTLGLKNPVNLTTPKGTVPNAFTTHSACKTPSDLQADLAKRDFTMNALAYSDRTGLIDYHNGLADLRHQIIRCVGRPEERFAEDGLRIMRGLRFAAVFGFRLEPRTRTAIFKQKLLLKHQAKERLAAELSKLLCGSYAQETILAHTEVLGVILPELLDLVQFRQNNPYHVYDVLHHTAATVAGLPQIPHLRLAGLLHDIAKPQCYSQDIHGSGHFYGHPDAGEKIARRILQDLKYDTFTIDRVCTLVKYHDLPLEASQKHVKRWLNKLSPAGFQDLLTLKKADILAQTPAYYDRLNALREMEEITARLLAKGGVFSLKSLQINGHDLLALGIPQGKTIGTILNRLLTLVIEEQIENEFSVLQHYAVCLYNLKLHS